LTCSSVVAIKSQVGGELTKVHFSEGQFVNKGDTIFTVDPLPFETSLSQAEANLARDTAQAKNAAAQAEHYTNLLASGVVSRDQYDQYRTNADALTETVRADMAQALGVTADQIENAL
jgi:membrane fusion protein, multidrug efflux system